MLTMGFLSILMRPLLAAIVLIAGVAGHDASYARLGAQPEGVAVARSLSIDESDRVAFSVADLVTTAPDKCPVTCAGGCVAGDLVGCCTVALLPWAGLTTLAAVIAIVWPAASVLPSGIDPLGPADPPRLDA